MLTRPLGQETEYAIRFTPWSPRGSPGNLAIYAAIAAAVKQLVASAPGDEAGPPREQFFVENGGAYYYESLPTGMDGGLVEGATPECRGPSQLLLYQKASEALLLRALPLAEQALAEEGYRGSIGLLKNSRDAEGNVYGTQESYEVEVASGPRLLLFRIGLALIAPVAVCNALLTLLLHLLAMAPVMVRMASDLVRGGPRLLDSDIAFGQSMARAFGSIGRFMLPVDVVLQLAGTVSLGLLIRLLGFREVRRGLVPFLVSRSVLTGCGTLVDGDRFHLSEKAGAITRVLRYSTHPHHRPIIDTGNLMKALISLALLRLAPLRRLFGRRLRLQIGFCDSNVAQAAEYLKIGTTSLVIDMAEAGFLADVPRPARPVEALRRISADASLTATVEMAGGGAMTALELQRLYLERARAYVAAHRTPALEAHEVVRLWGEALDALETDPAKLVGRLDWVTKRYLLERCGSPSPAVLKKIDLKYHELGCGYLAELERCGLAPVLTTAAEVEGAIRTPPEASRAATRSRLIRELAASGVEARVSWDRVRIRQQRFRPMSVIRLDDYRR